MEFVGIDFSATAIGKGAADVAALQLTNIYAMLPMDVRNFGTERFAGTFDYIIAHGGGVYSAKAPKGRCRKACWRSARVSLLRDRNRLRQLQHAAWMACARRGFATRSLLCVQFSDARLQGCYGRARCWISSPKSHLQATKSPWGAMPLLEEAQRVRQQPDGYIFHFRDISEAVNANRSIFTGSSSERAARRHGLLPGRGRLLEHACARSVAGRRADARGGSHLELLRRRTDLPPDSTAQPDVSPDRCSRMQERNVDAQKFLRNVFANCTSPRGHDGRAPLRTSKRILGGTGGVPRLSGDRLATGQSH